MSAYEKVLAEVTKEFPKFQMVEKKDSFLMKIINVFLLVITFGMMRTFMTQFTTVIRYKMYVPSSWEDRSNTQKISTLKHECTHFRQLQRYGAIWFTISYLFLWFPTVFSYFRKKYEQEAYEESMRYMAAEYGAKALENLEYREQMIRRFTSYKYFWTWPWRKSIEHWYDSTVMSIKANMGEPLT